MFWPAGGTRVAGYCLLKTVQKLKNPREFSLVYSQGRPHFGRFIVVSILPTDRKVSRVGFAVSKKVGKAVVRNKVKRRLRELMRPLGCKLPPGFDLVIGAKRSAAAAGFGELRQDLLRTLQGSGLLTRTMGGEGHA